MSLFSRTDQSLLAQWWWTVDRVLLGMIFSLYIIGTFMVATASPSVALRIGLSEYHFFIRHLIVLIPAIFIMVGISMVSVQNVWRGSLIVLGLSFLALIYVLMFGMEIKGAQRWIHLPGFSLQPSEFAKPAFIIVASWFIAKQKDKSDFPGFKFAWGLYGLLLVLLVMQPDMGMTFLVTVSFMAVIFLAGLPLRYVIILAVMAVIGVFLAYFTLSHVQDRVDRFLNPEIGDTYQVDKSLEAFKNGGFIGTGPGQGEVKLRIPDSHADFIFSVAAEELGLVFIIILISLYAYIFIRCFNRIMDSDNIFVILSVGGLLTMFALQALIHMGSSLHILPTKGMTLPLISYGGSSLLSMSMVMGMILALTRKQGKKGITNTGLFKNSRRLKSGQMKKD